MLKLGSALIVQDHAKIIYKGQKHYKKTWATLKSLKEIDHALNARIQYQLIKKFD